MYHDKDGVATKQSQAVYDSRIRSLLFATRLLSFVGLGTAFLNGEYAGENLQLPVSPTILDLVTSQKLLWVRHGLWDAKMDPIFLMSWRLTSDLAHPFTP
jgi:hypothetical protein